MAERPRLNFRKPPKVTVKRTKNITITDVNNMENLVKDLPVIKEAVIEHMAGKVHEAIIEVFKRGGVNPTWEPNTLITSKQKGSDKPLIGMTKQLLESISVRGDVPGGEGNLTELLGANAVVRFVGWFGTTHEGTMAGAAQRFTNTRNVPPLTDAQLAFVHEFGLPPSRHKGVFRTGIPPRPHATQAADCFGPGILEEGALMLAAGIQSYATVKPIHTPVLSSLQGGAS